MPSFHEDMPIQDATLRRVEDEVNTDVEMQVSLDTPNFMSPPPVHHARSCAIFAAELSI